MYFDILVVSVVVWSVCAKDVGEVFLEVSVGGADEDEPFRGAGFELARGVDLAAAPSVDMPPASGALSGGGGASSSLKIMP